MLKYASLHISFSNAICNHFSVLKDSIYRELVVDIEKGDAIII